MRAECKCCSYIRDQSIGNPLYMELKVLLIKAGLCFIPIFMIMLAVNLQMQTIVSGMYCNSWKSCDVFFLWKSMDFVIVARNEY